MVMGQSNHVGQSSTYIQAVAPGANPGWITTEYDKSGLWRQNVETVGTPFDSTGQGSYFGRLATYLMAAGVPCAFVPCALGSTNISGWVPGQAYYDNSAARATLLGDHKGVLWWQGEQDANIATSQASYEASLNSSVNDWCVTKFPGKKWILMNINNVGLDATNAATIHAAIAHVGVTNTHVGAVGDMLGRFSNSIHYGTGGATEVNNVALTAYNALNAAYVYIVPDTTAPVMTGAVGVSAIAQTSFTLSWSAATDAVGTTGYQYNIGAGWVDVGLVLTTPITGRTAGTGYTCQVRAYDAALNYATPISAVVTTLATLATTVTFSVLDAAGAAVTGLTGLDYAFFDQSRISQLLAPVKVGANLAISGGNATFSIAGVTSLAVGATGYMRWGDAAGTKSGGGPVVVS
jgi:hypothetical protein